MTEWSIDGSPRRRWKTKDYDVMTCYLGMSGRISLGDLLDHFTERYPHVDIRTVELNFATVIWDESPTVDDRAKLAADQAWQAERQKRWERETYERLKAKFEGPDQ